MKSNYCKLLEKKKSRIKMSTNPRKQRQEIIAAIEPVIYSHLDNLSCYSDGEEVLVNLIKALAFAIQDMPQKREMSKKRVKSLPPGSLKSWAPRSS